MARLYDLMLAHGPRPMPWDTEGEFDRTALRGATCIVAQNVYDYYMSHPQDDWWLEEDFPNVAPPFQRFWIEWREPAVAVINRGDRIEKQDNAGGGVIGFLFEAFPADGGGWTMVASTFVTRDGEPMGPQAMLHLSIDPRGRVTLREDRVVPTMIPGGEDLVSRLGQDAVQNICDGSVAGLKVAALTISFMHCRNVEVREVKQARGARRSWNKRNGRPLVRYKVLDIDPMKKTLESEGGASETGLKKALHICRGHFATYTEDAPLFGHYVGTVWKPQHVRGSAKEGVVVKDYNVKAPAPIPPDHGDDD